MADSYRIDDGLAAVEALARYGEVSLETAGNRLVSLADEPSVFLVLAMTNKPADTPAQRRGEDVPPKVRVRFATWPT